MAERASIFQGVRIGVEATSGAIPTVANRLLTGLSIQPSIKAETKRYRAMGRKFASVTTLGKEWTESSLEGPATYTEIVYPLSSVIAQPVIEVPSGATSARSWVFAIKNGEPDERQTFAVEQGDFTRAHGFSNGFLTEFGIDFSRDEITVNGTMFGRRLEDDISFSSSAPVVIALIPVQPIHYNIYLADDFAGLASAAALERPLKASWKLSDRAGPVWPLNRKYSSFAATVETEPSLEITMLMEADTEGMSLLPVLRSGQTRFIRLEACGPEIEPGQNYLFRIDTAVQVSDVGEFSDEDGVYAVEWTFGGADALSWDNGKTIEITVINGLVGL